MKWAAEGVSVAYRLVILECDVICVCEDAGRCCPLGHQKSLRFSILVAYRFGHQHALITAAARAAAATHLQHTKQTPFLRALFEEQRDGPAREIERLDALVCAVDEQQHIRRARRSDYRDADIVAFSSQLQLSPLDCATQTEAGGMSDCD